MTIDPVNLRPEISTSLTKAICHLHEHGPTKAKHLTLAVGISTAGATQLFDRGEQLGLLTRNRIADDRRSIVLALTEIGRETVESFFPTQHAR